MYLNIENLGFSYGTDEIFEAVKLRVDEKDRIGLVGRNGSGKSTLIKLITGALQPENGHITKRSGLEIGCLDQIPEYEPNTTLHDVFTHVFDDVIAKEARMRELEELIAKTGAHEDYLKEYGDLQEYFSRENAYSWQSRIRGTAAGLAFSEEDLKKPFSLLSGGEKTRAALGALLLSEPELLLLDEPTNYLDIASLQWLEGVLKNYPGSFILVSHDRYFMDRVCTRIDEIENCRLTSYNGNYSTYLKKKEKLRMDQDAQYASAMREIARQKAIIRRYRDINSMQSSKHARSREIALEKMTVPEQQHQLRDASFSFNPRVRSGDEVLNAVDLSKSFGDRKLFENVNFKVMRTEKIGIIGPNGAGKTTLFNILRRKEPRDTGRFTLGRKVIPGWFDQETRDLDFYADMNLIDTLRAGDSTMTDGEARHILASFLFTGEDVFKKTGDLSGGEKARLKLARLMLSESNFLLMDEPTNHIDMPTREILEDALCAYQGTLLFISHDRYFLNKVATKILCLTPDGLTESLGNYDDYIRHIEEAEKRRALSETPEASPTKTQQKAEHKRKKEEQARLRKLKRSVKETEDAVEASEEKIAGLEAVMAEPAFYENRETADNTIADYNALKQTLSVQIKDWEEAVLALEAEEEA